MSPIYPELKTQEKHIISVLKSEVEKFSTNLIHGQQILQKILQKVPKKRSLATSI